MKKELLVILLLLLISIPAVKSLFIPGGFTSHDLTHHIVRQINMDKLLSEGQFPPRWSGDLNQGYGYPLFLFNYPLPALIGQLFHWSGFGFVDSVKAVLFGSMILSVFGMYLFLRKLLGSRPAAFVGAVFYLYAPIRFFYIYVSASVGAALALGILPFVFWGLLQRSIIFGSISLAALILAHNVTALIFAPAILFFGWKAKRIILLGLGLSAWFWLPAVYEKDLTKFNDIFYKFYQNHFPSLVQLIRSPWGHGLSDPQNYNPGGMSYSIGLIHIGAVLVYGLWFMVKGRKSKDKFFGVFALAAFLVSVFLMLKASLFVWKSLPFLSLVQFPWRFLSLTVFAASILAALLIKNLPSKRLLVFSLLLLVIYANRNHWRINQVFDPGEKYYLSLTNTATSYGEHLPKWGRIMEKQAPAKLEFIEGGGKIQIIENKSTLVLANVEVTGQAKLRFNQFYFPGWEIKVDNKIVDFGYLIDGESYGLPVFDMDKGSHKVKAEFKNTPIRNLADSISVITVIIFIIVICKPLVRDLSRIKKFF